MKYKFFCDENITKKLQNTIRSFGFQVDSVRDRKLFGARNGDLVALINSQNFTLVTFDKDFLDINISASQGIIILDVNPNRDEFTIPLIKEFLNLLKENKIDCTNHKIVLNQDFLSKM
jgi:predicted nuclease of predicted toxin-antitoxin system